MTLRRLARVEINLLKHLVLHAPYASPIIVPDRFRVAFVPLWRLGLIDIWYRQHRDGGPCNQFVSLTVDGHQRINAIMANTPAFTSRRLASPLGQDNGNDQSSKPQQGQGYRSAD